MRQIIFVAPLMLLAACAQTWDNDPPTAKAGGTALSADGIVQHGDDAVGSIAQLPVRTAQGAQPPYGSNGQGASYEYSKGYKVGAGDRLTVRVVGEPDLTNDYLVDGAGNISMPYVNTAQVAGMTAPQIAQFITSRLRQGYLRNPSVSVQVTNLRPFFILGEVTTAGSFAYQEGMTVQNAVAIAGGYAARANQGEVMITRKSANGTITRKAPVTTQVYPGDVIYVRERWF